MDELGVWKVLAQPSSSLAGKMSHVQNVDPALKLYKWQEAHMQFILQLLSLGNIKKEGKEMNL